jgi:hypothetical protein
MANFVAHFAIHVDDVDRAQRFYKQAFGWRFEPWGPPGFPRVFTGDDETGVTEGALHQREEAHQPPLRGYRCSISVASISDTKEAITASGGVVSGPVFELPGVGKILNFEDPEGNVVAAVEDEPHLPMSASRKP